MNFLDHNFLLHTDASRILYHDHAASMPIIDYHCHLNPKDIAENRQFANLTEIWLEGDHYKWRAMRTNGVAENEITGNTDPYTKFKRWAETVPFTARNPLFHWTHMELRNPFGIEKILGPKTANEIWEEANYKLSQPEFRVQGLLNKFNVEVVCTTDDPIDNLEWHDRIREQGLKLKVLPTWRPDKAIAIDNTSNYNLYINRLSEVSGIDIGDFERFLQALKSRHEFFISKGCRLSDHGLEVVPFVDFNEFELKTIFNKVRQGMAATPDEVLKFQSGMLHIMAIWDAEAGFTQQWHIGAIRNNNSRMMRQLGPDTGFDSIGDFVYAKDLARFLDRLDSEDKLAKTILYNLNPANNEMLATMIGNFNVGGTPGKIQFGSGWWFLDQKDGMTRQINALSNMGLLSRFVGMLTDSRSFLSFPRHEYFRRILCQILGNDVANGELPADFEWLGKMVEDISYNNARNYFGFYQ